jgi:hypothetical protein
MIGLQSLILFFNIPMGMQKYILEIYNQFGHAPWESFVSHALDPPQRRRYCALVYGRTTFFQVPSNFLFGD